MVPILVMVNRGGLNERFEGVPIIGPDYLPATLREFAGAGDQTDLQRWLADLKRARESSTAVRCASTSS